MSPAKKPTVVSLNEHKKVTARYEEALRLVGEQALLDKQSLLDASRASYKTLFREKNDLSHEIEELRSLISVKEVSLAQRDDTIQRLTERNKSLTEKNAHAEQAIESLHRRLDCVDKLQVGAMQRALRSEKKLVWLAVGAIISAMFNVYLGVSLATLLFL